MRQLLRVVLALFFVTAGTLHFLTPVTFAKIVPPYLPYPFILVWISGVCEIMGGCGILVPRLRRAAGWGLIALLIAVFPANLYMAMGNVQVGGFEIPPWMLWLRLPLQGVLIAWAWWVSRDGSGDRAI
jgi:uncharacterized membrane protein